ncbi:kinase-like protein [Polyporus arcularius HHB13444]|uniref:Kinase-like protein n=1 Tax=Polyporus arcularius HHB13444 TaxID=1314778 RepID=A0A5C3PUL0_9APHY|nr:kinase-like protein [Polyporus arcularius HHB13444]
MTIWPNAMIALKRLRYMTHEPLYPLLRHEACALVLLQGHPSIPTAYAYGASQHYEYLALQLLGETLHSHFVMSSNRLAMRNLAAIAYQMLDVLEHVHSRGIVHCDLSLKNIMFDFPGPSQRIYLIDFGLCLSYLDKSTGRHRPDEKMPRVRGTYLYASLNNHLHHTPSRRDDLEALAYVLIRLLRGGLPWQGVRTSAELYEKKRSWSGAGLCAGWPAVFGEFLDYCRTLDYDETPDYQRWKRSFASATRDFTGWFDMWDKTNCVGSVRDDTAPICLPTAESLAESVPWRSVMSRFDSYEPLTEFEAVYTLSAEDMLAPSEQEVISTGLYSLSRVPLSDRPYLTADCSPERLVGPN